MSYLISGIQQLGVGVADVEAAWAWYRTAFGMDVPVFQEEADAPLMTRYTGGEVRSRNAVLALNLCGGAGFEIWQYTSRKPVGPERPPRLGDLGIFAGVMKSRDPREAHAHLERAGAKVTPVASRPDGAETFFATDPFGNLFQVAPATEWFGSPRAIGGVGGAVVGCSDVERSLPLYRDVLGYDRVVYDERGEFDDLRRTEGGDAKVRRVLLAHSEPRRGAFAELTGAA
ncbi:MAG: VOC family protein, partial [Spirochaetota bacterium]